MATSRKSKRTIASGRAKWQLSTRIFFQRAAPLTGFASVQLLEAAQFNGLTPSLIFGAESL
jgi:hypothetical protein